ncbi:MAG: chromate transporter [Lachnospiraceae bacterium]|nr:chromate transporter [Lachnospiraceae bacterium]
MEIIETVQKTETIESIEKEVQVTTQDNKFIKGIKLFAFFVKIGCFTFGGGWSILAQMEQEFVNKRHDITKEELLDIVSVGKSVPGIMITNISMIFGYQVAGIWGGICSVIGITFPAVVILSIITVCYAAFKDNYWVGCALSGIRAAVAPIIFSSMWSLGKTALKDKFSWCICGVVFLLCSFTSINNVIIILMGVVLAIIRMGVIRKNAA